MPVLLAVGTQNKYYHLGKGIVVLMECSLRFSLAGPDGMTIKADDAKARLEVDSLSLVANDGTSHFFSLRDIVTTRSQDFRIEATMVNGQSLVLFKIGDKYEDLAKGINRSRNEQLIRDLLMQEPVRKQSVPGELRMGAHEEQKPLICKCEVRVYQSTVAIMPEKGEFIRLPLSNLAGVSVEKFSLTIRKEDGSFLTVGKLGRELEPLRKAIADGMAEQTLRIKALLKDLVPEADPINIENASRLIKEGKAVNLVLLDQLVPGSWMAMEKRLEGADLGPQYQLLTSLGIKEKTRVGIKRTRSEEGTTDYIWLFVPITSTSSGKAGNAIAFEASSEDDTGRATYFFRIAPREEFRRSGAEGESFADLDRILDRTNAALEAINFRREPIYLEEGKLYTPEYSRYRYAMMKVPELRDLRARFIGRVIHSDPLQWATDVSDLLSFNVSAKDDDQRWAKKEGEPNE